MPKLVSVFGIEPFRIGGNEAFARELSLQLGELGWESVLCFLTAPPEEVRAFLQLPNVTIEVLKDSVGVNLKGIRGLASVLKRYRPQLLHLHFVNFLGVFPWLAKLYGVKGVFITDHGSRPAGYVPQRAVFWKRALVRVINRPITRVTCVSNYGYNCFTTLDLLPKDRFVRIYNSVDLKRVSPTPERAQAFRRKYGIPADRTIVLQVSWIIPEKGISGLLEAARRVLSVTDKVQFVFVGEGAYRSEYSAKAQEMGIAENVTWTGLVEHPFAEGVFDAADIVCQVSNWEEVFGWAIAEAMGFRKPIIGTRVGGIPELVEDGVNGFLVERGASDQIAERLLELHRDPELRARMGERARQLTEEKFDLRNNVKKFIEYYGL
ncbi:MAG TPA: glycosyltransferase family 4 protein [Pyrinomonadaceae bacterium]|jgi:Glycosyltransferase|nr:glycosyltransferase family 4 protein [Pyrinomonadaceae bacterium]